MVILEIDSICGAEETSVIVLMELGIDRAWDHPYPLELSEAAS
jgi:hypothetical protein